MTLCYTAGSILKSSNFFFQKKTKIHGVERWGRNPCRLWQRDNMKMAQESTQENIPVGACPFGDI